MTFKEILYEIVSWAEKDGRVSYRAIKRQFDEVDDEYLEDLKDAIFYAYPIEEEKQGFRWKPRTAERPGSDDNAEDSSKKVQAERRRITVMFCDLADSTPLSQQLDPEDLRKVIRAYQKTAAAVIHKYEGYVAQYLGDGLLVYFGWPHAHENEAERALLTGIEILESINDTLNPKLRSQNDIELAVRIGVHTGLVVVGQMGEKGRYENLATGDTVNIAARIESLADPNSVMISEATNKLISRMFYLEDRGIANLKGVSTGTRLYKVVGKAENIQDVSDDKIGSGPFLVGRDEEIGLLNRRWEQAKRKLGQIVHISGAAGIGKSGLVEALRAEVKKANYQCVVIRCSAYHQNSAYFPLALALANAVDFDDSESDQTKLEYLERYIESIDLPLENTVPFLCKLLSIETGNAYENHKTISPQKQKQLTSDAIVSWLFKLAQQHPLLLIWEDLHWADPSTLEVVEDIVEQVPTVPMLSVLTYRTQFIPHWRQHSHITPIVLNRLEPDQAEALIARHANNIELPKEVVAHIVQKTDGVPLFIEELTRMFLKSGIMRLAGSKYELSGPLASISIPDTLQDSLMARLDQLNEAKQVAQFGSVIGREFSYESIQAIYEGPADALNDGLEKLLAAELLYVRGRIPDSIYIFKHGLLQDAAYDTLLKSKRQEIHLAIGKYIETNLANIVRNQPELLAHHFTQGQDYNKALEYWLKAGRLSKLNSSHAEAIAHIQNGLQIVGKLKDQKQRLVYELDLQLALGTSLIATEGYAYAGVGEALQRAKALASELDDTERMYGVLWGLCAHSLVLSNNIEARQAGIELSQLSTEGYEGLYVLTGVALGVSSYALSEFDISVKQLEAGIISYKKEHHEWLIGLCGMDVGVLCLAGASHSAWHTGQIDRGLKWSNEALTIAEGLAHPFTRSVARAYAAMLHQFMRDTDRTQEFAASAIALCSEQHFPYYLAWGKIIHGWCVGIQGSIHIGQKQISYGLSMFRDTGSFRSLPYYYSLQAEIEAASGNLDRAIATLDRAIQTAHEINEHWWESELHRLKGEYLLGDSVKNIEQTRSLYHKALDICDKQGAKTLGLRAATSLAKLLSGEEKHQKAIDLLNPILDSFNEGYKTQDLHVAQDVLNHLVTACTTAS